jgi:phosphodiesterase/alkaline phosphatase D-like protein
VAIYELVLLPEVTTGDPSEEQRTSAKLEGEVNPGGEAVTSCEFEYGTSTAYGKTAACATSPGSGTSPVAVRAEATGLTAQTTYHYRLVARNAHGPRAGADHEFTTLPAVEGVLTGQASDVQGTTATLGGSLEPNGNDTHYFFEYGLSESYGSTTAGPDAGSATEDKQVSVPVGALEPNQIYHYRLVAENTFGKTFGADTAFRTAALPPLTLGAPSASFIGSQSVVLSASLNPENTNTTYTFRYAKACSSGEVCPAIAQAPGVAETPAQESSAYGTVGVTLEARGLQPATTYRVQLVASNEKGQAAVSESGSSTLPEGTFTTGQAPAPAASTGAASGVDATSATISGRVNPDGLPATYSFELGVYEGAATQYGDVFSGPAGTTATPTEETLALTGLQPGTTYAYRIAVHSGYIHNSNNTMEGATEMFTTAGVPAVIAVPAPLAQLAIPAIAFPKEAAIATTTPKVLTKAQKLANALKTCRKDKQKNKRTGCERVARKKYAPTARKKAEKK